MNFFLGLLSCVYFLVGVEGAIRRLCYTYNRVGFVWNSKLSPLDQFTQLQAWKVGGAGTKYFLYEYGEEHGFRHSTNNYWASETMTRAGTKLEEMRDDNKTTAEEFIAMETFYVLANVANLSQAQPFSAVNLLWWYDTQLSATHLLHDRVLECLKKYSGSSRGTNEKTRAKWQQRLQKSEQALQHRSEGKYIESNQLLVVLLPGMLLEMRWGDDPKWYLVRYALLLDDKTKKITKNVTMVVMDGVASGRFKFVPEGKKADDWRYPIFPKFSKDDVVSIIVKMDGHPQVATVVDVKDDHTYTCASGTGKEGSSSGENFELDVFYKQATQVSKTVKKKRKR